MSPGQEVTSVLSHLGAFCILPYLYCILHNEQGLLSWQNCSSGIHLLPAYLQSCSPEALRPGLSGNKVAGCVPPLLWDSCEQKSWGGQSLTPHFVNRSSKERKAFSCHKVLVPGERKLGQPILVSKDNLSGNPESCYRPHLPYQAMGLTQAPAVPSEQPPSQFWSN